MTLSAKTDHDVIVVGGGPAGSATAIRLANAGVSVMLVEKARFPRQKLCGEFISPECLEHFNELGVAGDIKLAGGVDIAETVFYSRNGKGVAVKSEWFGQVGSRALGLSRAEMDDVLLRRAREVGVSVREATTAAGLIFDGERVIGVRLKDKDGIETPVTANVIIDATGRTRSLARRLEKDTGQHKRAGHVAFKAHLAGAQIAAGACEIFAYRGGYGGCNSIENGLYNLCFIADAEDVKRLGSDAERVMREVVFSNNRAASVLENVTIESEWLAVPIERYGRGELVPAQGLLTVGDSAAFIDPFTGSGILLSLEGARIAATAIAKSFAAGRDPETLAIEYQRKYSSAFDARLRVCRILRHAASMPFLADATISVLRASGGLGRRLAMATRLATRRA
ncbi:MAG TPA: NAD(P)/FAD-dependent oxidoreductase [Pyrinomonadaceae bacterium]|nr:NAD(P)/FAD-dependent oxidoreductase [Pyrinomonadaceae bacterium]